LKIDSVKVDTTTMKPHHSAVAFKGSDMVYNFPASALYPDDNGATLNVNHFVVNGTIVDANFDSGAFRVETASGEVLDIQFYPLDFYLVIFLLE